MENIKFASLVVSLFFGIVIYGKITIDKNLGPGIVTVFSVATAIYFSI